MSFLVKIRQFFQPYYVPKPKKLSKRKIKKQQEKEKRQQAQLIKKQKEKQQVVSASVETENVSKTEQTSESTGQKISDGTPVPDAASEAKDKQAKEEEEFDAMIARFEKEEKEEKEKLADQGESTESPKQAPKLKDNKPVMRKPKAVYEPARSKGKDILLKTRISKSEARTSLTGEPLQLMVMNYPATLNNWLQQQQKPTVGQIWTHHNAHHHQVLAHLAPKTSHVVGKELRSNERRAQLKAWLRPISKRKAYHRTHIIPFGYHGSESDPRLVVGWIASHNEKQLNDFEIKQRNRTHSIYWFVDIKLLESGRAEWHAEIYDVRTLKKVDELTLRTNETFMWRKDGIKYVNG